MYYPQKKAIATISGSFLVMVIYCVYVYRKYQEGVVDIAYDLKFWATSILIFIGISIAAMIIVMIIFHIINAIVIEAKNGDQEENEMKEEDIAPFGCMKNSAF